MLPTPQALLPLSILFVFLLHQCDCFQPYKISTRRLSPMPQLFCIKSADSEMNWDPKSGPKLDFNEDYYSVLDVDCKVDAKELKKAYYKLVFKYHPDNIENESSKSMCNKQMMVINGAYRILKNIDLRVLYDRQRRKGLVGIGAGIKENTKTVPSSTPPASQSAPQPNSETRQSPPKSTEGSASRGKKYSESSGFGGSWTVNDDGTDAESDSEEEYLDQERERERQRQRYQEPQPQTQRQRDQQTRDRDREFDFNYGQSGADSTPNRTPWGFNTNTYDQPVRPADRYRESETSDIDNVEDFLRRTGSGVSDMYENNITGLKRKLEMLCARKVMKEREMDRMSAGVTDWGEVTDVRLIRKRIEDINEMQSLSMQISDLSDEIADLMLRSRTPPPRDYRSQGTARPDPAFGFRPPVDLWGEAPSRSAPPRTATRPPPRTVTPPRPASKRAPQPGSINWDAQRNVKGDDAFEYNFDEDTLDQFGEKKEEAESAWRKSRRSPRSDGSSSSTSGGRAFASFLFEDENGEDVDDEEEEDTGPQDKNAVLNELLRVFKMNNKRKK